MLESETKTKYINHAPTWPCSLGLTVGGQEAEEGVSAQQWL